jgi:hypothetical protein
MWERRESNEGKQTRKIRQEMIKSRIQGEMRNIYRKRILGLDDPLDMEDEMRK